MVTFRRLTFIFLAILLSGISGVHAQKNMIFRMKTDAFAGKVFDGGGLCYGLETDLELPMYGDENLDYTFNFPSLGFALGAFDTENFSCVDPVIYTYPYFLYPIIHKPVFELNMKFGLGIGTFVHHGDSVTGKVFPATGLGMAGLHMNFALGKKYGKPRSQWMLSLGANAMGFHNAHVIRRSKNFVMVDGVLGLSYTPNVYPLPIKDKPKKVRRVLAMEGSLQGGAQQLDRSDDIHLYPNGSLSYGFYLPITNAWRLGLGGDAMYNSVYDGTQRPFNKRYNFIKEEDPMTMFRAGAFFACDFTIYRLTAGIHVGAYLYDKIIVPDQDEDGVENTNPSENYMYEKLVTKYYITKNFYALLQIKTHYTEVECGEMGFGFAIPDFGSRVKNPFARISFKKENWKELKID